VDVRRHTDDDYGRQDSDSACCARSLHHTYHDTDHLSHSIVVVVVVVVVIIILVIIITIDHGKLYSATYRRSAAP